MRRSALGSRLAAFLGLLALVGGIFPAPGPLVALAPSAVRAAAPTSVTIAGSLQSEAGCPGDWAPNCAATHMTFDAADGVWQASFTLPAGNFEYKAALNDSWTENYGLHAQADGANIPLDLGESTTVKFYYDPVSHWVTDNVNSVIATVPGSFQSELGCPGDWQPDCLRSWLEDPDGDHVYTFETTSLPAGTYAAKVAINEGWAENYGQGGVPNGVNLAFTVPFDGAKVQFSYDATSHVLAIRAGHAHDNNVEWDGLRHDSRDPLYRSPGGAVPAGTPVVIRFRTFHDDVTGVKARVYSVARAGQEIVPMTRAAADVSCYQAELSAERCDFWQVTLPASQGEDNLWYRFIVTDGTKTAYYADDTAALDGGLGAASDAPVDQSWALTLYHPGFTAPAWASSAVVYQVFPDRFRNGRKDNDPKTGDARYADPVIKLPWGVRPEGYCRNYADAATNCPWRYETNPPASSPTVEQPRGRDYFGGDLKGLDQQLDYLAGLGITTLYLNPVFDAASNHGYDTQDYTRIDPYFGTAKDWDNLVKHARNRGMRIILDGVFNHMSTDSPFFDRYGHYATVGACESVSSPWRAWFTFTPQANGPCAGPDGAHTMTYAGWFGFDSIPVINKSLPAVQAYFLTAPDAIATRWLKAGASGWRLDVSGDASFPNGYWETFRGVVKTADPNALTISETWQKDSTLLRMLRGDRLDTTMDYRFRDAVVGLLAPGAFDSKGFADSGHPITASAFANRLASIREDYPDAAYFSLLNLLDSHDTERLLWTLTPGVATTAGKESPAALAAGKSRMRLASLVQFTVGGMPTIYYGDEVGMTGAEDPDDRRTYPWADLGGSPDMAMFAHYQALTAARRENPALTAGDFRVLLANEAAGTVAYGRETTSRAAVVALNTSGSAHTLTIPVAGYVPDGYVFTVRYGVGTSAGAAVAVAGGVLTLALPAMSGAYLATASVDLQPPSAPANLRVTDERANTVALAWDAVPGAAGYDVYVSPVTGGGYVKANSAPVTGTSFDVTGLDNARRAYFVVRALDAAGNASLASDEVSGVPHLVIGWANLQWPPTLTHTISATNPTETAYGQVWIDGATSQPGPTPSLRAQLGFGPAGTSPASNAGWTWVDAAFNVDAGDNDEFKAALLPDATGSSDYVYRYTVTDGRDWLYADLNGPIMAGALPSDPGRLTVNPSADTTAPATPTGLAVTGGSPASIELAWDAVAGDPTLYGYEVLRGDAAAGPYAAIATVTAAGFADTTVSEGSTYWYEVRSVDTSFNRSAASAPVQGTAALRTVTLTFNVTVPATTDATGRTVHIAGFLDRLDGNLPQWDPGATSLSRVDATHWTITLSGKEATQIEYKYTLGDWDHVEKDATCGEISNRQLTLSFGSTGTQVVNDTVLNWRNVAPCGN